MHEPATSTPSNLLPHGGPFAGPLAALLDAPTDEARLDALTGLFASLPDRGGLHALLDLLERDPALRRKVQAATGEFLAETYPVEVFSEIGIPADRSFFGELGRRVSDRVVPRPRDSRHLMYMLPRLAGALDNLAAVRNVSIEDRLRLFTLLFPPGDSPAWSSVGAAFVDAFRLLALRIESLGLSPEFRERATSDVVTASPFFRFGRASDALLGAVASGEGVEQAAARWREARDACLQELLVVRRHLGDKGISVEIVYGVEVITRAVARMNQMLKVITAGSDLDRSKEFFDLLTALLASSEADRSILHLLRRGLRMLHRRIVDRSGEVGEHYIASGWPDYRRIWVLAAGGGIVAALIAITKSWVHYWPLAPFLLGIAYGLAYTGGFLLMQRLDLILATKQPAMTGATLAGLMQRARGEAHLGIASVTARITSSQLAAAISNVLLVTLAAYGFNAAWRWSFDAPYMPTAAALEVYRHYSPLDSLTVLYAAETGVILWLASVAGGWFDNWVVLHDVPEGITHAWGRYLGDARAGRWAESLRHGAGALGTNVALGFMLGLAPEIGHFFGLPIDARHVTLSTGQLALAAASLEYQWFGEGLFLHALAGIAVMFVLNLTVSFLLSLFTAARAFDVPAREVGALLWSIVRALLRNPLRFVFPQAERTT